MQGPTDATTLVEPAASPRATPIRIGVVGLGAVAQAVHLPLLAKHPDLFRPSAVCDLSPATCSTLGDRFAIPSERRYGSAEELLDDGELDAVAILSSGSHGALAEAAARRGLAIFCEKPIAYTLAEADALAGLEPTLLLAYMKLYDPAVERARELLRDRPPARSVEVTVLHPPAAPQLAHAGLLPAPVDVDPAALERIRGDEAALVERALGPVPAELGSLYTDVILGSIVHDLAVMRYLLGGGLELEAGEAWGDGGGHSVSLLGRLPGGARVSIRWHYLERYPAYREEIRIHDEAGTVSLAFPAPYLLHAPTELTVVDGEREAERTTHVRSTAEAFERQWLAFADLVRTGVAPRAGIADGREDIVVCQGAVRALAQRQGVAVGGEAAAGK